MKYKLPDQKDFYVINNIEDPYDGKYSEYEKGVLEFGMWLTTRDKVIKVGHTETVYDMCVAIQEYIKLKEQQ